MNEINSENKTITAKIRHFIARMMEEMKKCTWPQRDELMESTILVIVVLVISTAFIACIDQILYWIITFLTSI